MRVLITGSRTWDDQETIVKALEDVQNEHPEALKFVLVSGNCPQGADFLCERTAESLGWEIELHPADWAKFGKPAGFIRNKEMVELGADICLAFIKNNSKGASGTANLAKQRNIPLVEYRRNDLIQSGELRVKKQIEMRKASPADVEGDAFLF